MKLEEAISNIEKGNILISEFLDKPFRPYFDSRFIDMPFRRYDACLAHCESQVIKYKPQIGYQVGVGDYHENWNTLMEAVEKIINIDYETGRQNACFRTFGNTNGGISRPMVRIERMGLHGNKNLIGNVWDAVVEWAWFDKYMEKVKRDE